jgi:hypothetical protein
MNGSTATRPVQCPRCGARFTCGGAGPGPCACAGITLGATLQARLREAYAGCLCLACLRGLAAAERDTGLAPTALPER